MHLLTREVGLDTHVQDIVNVLAYEDLAGVILVGHSYGDMVITGVAERTPERVGHLVYLDAVAPFDEERSIRELLLRHSPAAWTSMEGCIAADDGWRIPVSSAEPLMGVSDAADMAWLRALSWPFTPSGLTFWQSGPLSARNWPRTD